MFGLGPQEFFLVVLLGILLFGKRLPEVGRSVGKTVMEFRNSLRGVQDELNDAISMRDAERRPPQQYRPAQRFAPTTPKFVEPEDAV